MEKEDSQNPLKTLKKDQKPKKGGYRPGSGRKPDLNKQALANIKDRISQHGAEVVELRSDGKITKMTRVEALLNIIFLEAIRGNIAAAKEYLDRQLGKSKQSVGVSEEKEILITLS